MDSGQNAITPLSFKVSFPSGWFKINPLSFQSWYNRGASRNDEMEVMIDSNYWGAVEVTCKVNLINAMSESRCSVQNYQYLHSCIYKVVLGFDLFQHIKDTFVKRSL